MSTFEDQSMMQCKTCGNNIYKNFMKVDGGHVCKCCGVWYKQATTQSEIREEIQCEIGYSQLKRYEFEAAKDTFRSIISEHPESINALWGALLARYGVVLVKGFFDDIIEPIYCFPEYDEYGGKKIKDEREYKKLMALLDEQDAALEVSYFYETKAKEIDNAIEKFTECKQNTDVDVFICVKISAATEEEPEKPGRTEDYEYAQRIYQDLTKRGINVFFSFVTLKNNVESDNLIWVNLVKSKKMLIVGSREEYLDSVWVKSEWKRWLYLGREKDLYICSMRHDNEYPKSILPRELANLHPQVYTLDTYEKMLDEICEGAQHNNAAEKTSYSIRDLITRSDKTDGKIIYVDGKEETIAYGVKEIAKGEYEGNQDIMAIVLPSSVTVIREGAFRYCKNLKYIDIPNSVNQIGANAFFNCQSLAEVALPSNVTRIEENSFSTCTSLESVALPDGLTYIGKGAFYSCPIRQISMPEKLKTIENTAFSHCNMLEKLEIPDSVTEIGEWAISNCEKLEAVALPNNLAVISEGMLAYNINLASVIIPKSVSKIEKNAFHGLKALKHIYYKGSAFQWMKIKIGEWNEKLNGNVFEKAKIHYNHK